MTVTGLHTGDFLDLGRVEGHPIRSSRPCRVYTSHQRGRSASSAPVMAFGIKIFNELPMSSLSNIIIKHKLPISFLLHHLFICLFWNSYNKRVTHISDLTAKIYEHPLVYEIPTFHAALNITQMHRSMNDVVLANSPDEIKHALNAVAENEQNVYQQLDTIQKDILGEEGKTLEKQTRQLFENWKPIRENVARLLNSGNKQEALLITKTNEAENVAKLEAKVLELTSYARNKADNFIELFATMQSNLEKITLILSISGVLISLIIAFITTKLVLKAKKLLQEKNDTLQKAIDEIKTLQGILPICMYCKEIRDDKGSWSQLEKYISDHSEARFSHGICDKCLKKHYPDEANLEIMTFAEPSGSLDADKRCGADTNSSLEAQVTSID